MWVRSQAPQQPVKEIKAGGIAIENAGACKLDEGARNAEMTGRRGRSRCPAKQLGLIAVDEPRDI
jgi:hypothetical protein